jgi:TolB protein
MKPQYRLILAFVFAFCLPSACNEDTVAPAFYGAIDGTVTFQSSGTPAAGVEITTSPTTSTVLTDDEGHFIMTDLPTGEYSVVAHLEGYKNVSKKIAVTKNNTTSTELQLVSDASTPNSPTAPVPAAGADNIERSITLKWSVIEKNDDELKYNIILFESNQPAPLFDVDDHADTVLTVENLKFNTTYFWQVDVKNTAGIVTHGQLWHFKTRPFPDNRYLFASQRDGNYEIYSSNETSNDLVRLTYSDHEQVSPQYSNDRNLIAYAEHTNLEYHIFTMNKDGSSPVKVTTLPVAGFHNDGRGFCWSPDNGRILYSHYDKLYSIDRNGSNLTLIATAPSGRTYRGCDWTAVGNQIVVETVGTLPYESEIRLIDLWNATDIVLVNDLPGAIQNPSFSIDGNYIIYTKDVSGFETETGRQLDSHIILRHIVTGAETDLSTGKDSGTNDLNPRFSPDGASVIFENRNNDGSGNPAIYTYDITPKKRTLLFNDAAMPDWL